MLDPESEAGVIGLIHQPYKHETLDLAHRVATFLTERQVESRILSAFELDQTQVESLALAITFGGDGTVLRAARWLAPLRIPILPVRMGTLSFLGELSPGELPERLEPYLQGDCWHDERAMLKVETDEGTWVALNDVVIGRGASPRAVKLDLWVDDAPVTRFVADGLVLATATGSTGYALAAGGPVLGPSLRDIIIQPIAPHLASLRSLVVPGESVMRIAISTFQPGVLTVDGQTDHPFGDGEQLLVRCAAETTVFARRGRRSDFFGSLTAKLARP